MHKLVIEGTKLYGETNITSCPTKENSTLQKYLVH